MPAIWEGWSPCPCLERMAVCIIRHCADAYRTTGGCYVGLAPLGQNASAWEPFSATFAPSESVVTVYINQEGTAFPSVVRGLTVLQRVGTRFLLAAPSLLRSTFLPVLSPS